ncbi:MAG: DUF6285 domain-containing protein [Myxococcales bacterium]|nr:DUF6285 domain-containing protein [Myxococcales bacterium]
MAHEPTTEELLRAVREWIKQEVMPRLDGYAQFRGGVALGALGTVQRELSLRPECDERARAGIADLLGEEGSLPALEAALCERIRAGEVDATDSRLLRLLRETTMARLAIDSPKYPSYLAARAREEA